jgi:hypothetical protein
MNEDQLRAKVLALFHSLVSSWANDLRGEVTGIQDQVNRQLDALQERMAKYEENIDETKIIGFVGEMSKSEGGGAPSEGISLIHQSMVRLDQGNSLTEVLTCLVQELSQLVPRIALFVLKGGACIGWLGQGFDQSPGFSNDAIKRMSVPSNADTVFRAVITSRQGFLGESTVHRENVQLLSRLGNVLPSSIFAMPMILKDRIAAVVYADSGDSRDALLGTESVEVLVHYACKLLDLISLSKGARPEPEAQPGQAKPLREQTFPPGVRAPVSPEPPAPAMMSPEPAVEELEDEDSGTVLFHASDLQAQSPTPPPAAPVAPPAPAAGSKQHEDAKRFARLLVSEIKLYNEAKVMQGRKTRDLYQQLRDDIDRSRKLYGERHPDAPPDFFTDELVRILADGDAGALGQS